MRFLAVVATVLGLVSAFNGSLALAADGEVIPVPKGFFEFSDGRVEAAPLGYFIAEIRDRMMSSGVVEQAAREEVCAMAVYACEKSTGFQCEAVRSTDTVGMTGHFWAPADFKCWAALSAVQSIEGTLR
jgi:hypothetical protein